MNSFGVQAADIPFLHRTMWVFCLDVAIMVIVTLTDPASHHNEKGLEIDQKMFKVTPSFIAGSALILGILAVLYANFW